MVATREEERLRTYMWVLFFLHLAGTVFYALAPHVFIRALNWTTAVIPLPPHPVPTERFWSIMAATMEAMLMICYLEVAKDVRRNIHYLRVLVLPGKLMTFLLFLLGFLLHIHSFAYLIGFLVDFGLFVSILYGYVRTTRSWLQATQ